MINLLHINNIMNTPESLENNFQSFRKSLLNDLDELEPLILNKEEIKKKSTLNKLKNFDKRLDAFNLKYETLYNNKVGTNTYAHLRRKALKLPPPIPYERFEAILDTVLKKKSMGDLERIVLAKDTNYPIVLERAKLKLAEKIANDKGKTFTPASEESLKETRAIELAFEERNKKSTSQKFLNAVTFGGKSLAALVAAPVAVAGAAGLAATGLATGAAATLGGGLAYGTKMGVEAVSTQAKKYNEEQKRLTGIRENLNILEIQSALNNTSLKKASRKARLNALNAYINQMIPESLGEDEKQSFLKVYKEHLKSAKTGSREQKILHKLHNKVLSSKALQNKLDLTPQNVNIISEDKKKRNASTLTGRAKAAGAATRAALSAMGSGIASGAQMTGETLYAPVKAYRTEKQKQQAIINSKVSEINKVLLKTNRDPDYELYLNALAKRIEEGDSNAKVEFVRKVYEEFKNTNPNKVNELYNKLLNKGTQITNLFNLEKEQNAFMEGYKQRQKKKTLYTNKFKAGVAKVQLLTNRLTGKQDSIEEKIEKAKTLPKLRKIEKEISLRPNGTNKGRLKGLIAKRLQTLVSNAFVKGSKQRLQIFYKNKITGVKTASNLIKVVQNISTNQRLTNEDKEFFKKLINNAITSVPETPVPPKQPEPAAGSSSGGTISAENVERQLIDLETNILKAYKTLIGTFYNDKNINVEKKIELLELILKKLKEIIKNNKKFSLRQREDAVAAKSNVVENYIIRLNPNWKDTNVQPSAPTNGASSSSGSTLAALQAALANLKPQK